MQENLTKFDLKSIAAYLEKLEEKIIFNLLQRGQYRVNSCIYQKGKSNFKKYPQLSLLEIRLKMQEEMDAKFDRFSAPEEKPFNQDLPLKERDFNYPQKENFYLQDFSVINLTAKIMTFYLKIIPLLCLQGDDKQYGSSVEADVSCLQAIAERIHFASFYVAEAKYREKSSSYQQLIVNKDQNKILKKLTRKEVEINILNRIEQKAFFYQKHINKKVRHFIEPSFLVKIYQEMIIPLTKEGEVKYLLQRKI